MMDWHLLKEMTSVYVVIRRSRSLWPSMTLATLGVLPVGIQGLKTSSRRQADSDTSLPLETALPFPVLSASMASRGMTKFFYLVA